MIDPASGFDQTADVLIVDGVIAEIGRVSPTANAKQIDAEGCIVSPGLIDPHAHLREPSEHHQETLATGLAAAINGGFTSVCCMPNTSPPIDSVELVEFIKHKGGEARAARIFTSGCATKGREGQALAEIFAMAKAGAVAFTDDGACVAEAGLMGKVLRTVSTTGLCFMQHCEEPSMTQGASMNAGPLAVRLGLGGWPAIAEEIIIERDVRLNRAYGCRYHVQHVSSSGSVEIIRNAQAEGQPITAEIAPHHLLLTEDAVDSAGGYNTMAKMNPPLRTQRDIEELKKAVADGTIGVLATDHAPHPIDRKALDFTAAPFGIVGLDCALPLYVKALIEDNVIDWPALLAMMTINPARLLGIDKLGLGRLSIGGPADVTIIDPALKWTIDLEQFASAGRNCPFQGWEVTSRAIATIVGGEIKLLRDESRLGERERKPKAAAASRA